MNKTIGKGAIAALLVVAAGNASAGSHLWRFSEIFSNADGTIQYLEMIETGGSDDEFHVAGKTLHSDSNAYTFPNNLPGMTADKNFLMATESYAALSGVAAPDFVIPDNFFNPVSDTVMLHTYDIYTFTEGVLPDDGYHALDRMAQLVVPNSPTNFNDETVVIDLSVDADGDGLGRFLDNCTDIANPAQLDTDNDSIGNDCDPDVALPNDCVVNFLDLEAYRTNFFSAGLLDTDNNGDGLTNFADLIVVKTYLFGPPGPSANGCN